MPTIDVKRSEPPAIGQCRGCGKRIEWTETIHGKRMPMNHPLAVERMHERHDGTVIATVDTSASHFASCPAAGQFRKRGAAR